MCQWHRPVCLQGTKASLRGIVDPQVELRCETDTCEWLVWRVQSNSLGILGGSGRIERKARGLGSPSGPRRDKMQRLPDIWPWKDRQRWGSPGQGSRPELSRGRKSLLQKQRGSAEIGPGKRICLLFDICRMHLFSSNQLTNLLENDTEITSKLLSAVSRSIGS